MNATAPLLRRAIASTAACLRRSPRPTRAALLVVALVTPVVTAGLAQSNAVSAAANVSAGLGQYGFPLWYEDATGVRVDSCLDTSDPHCVLLPSPGVFDTQQPILFPSNFPDEFFYSLADSEKLTTPGCAGAADPLAANPGLAFARLAVEGAFVNGPPAIGDQMVFGRVRIVVRGGLCPNTSYSFTHPYGITTLTTDASGSIKPVVGTVDIGCRPVATQPCDFSLALGSPLSTGYLRWDPSVAPLADPGYLGGDPAVLHPITGGVNNVFAVADPVNNVVVSTNLFSVAGRIAGPLMASPSSVDFGGQVVATTGNQQAVTLTNVGVDGLVVNAAGITTDNPEFQVVNSNCPGAAPGLSRDQVCTVQLTFTPGAGNTGVRTGNLTVAHSGLRSPFTLALRGTGTNPGQEPQLSVNPTTLSFGSVRIGTVSTSQTVTISNPGTAPLQVTALQFVNVAGSFNNLDKDAFRTTFNGCAGVFVPAQAAAHCDLFVAFQPTNTHPYSAALKVTANTAGGPVEVVLDATGIGGIAAVSKGANGNVLVDPSNGFPSWYQDEAGARLGQCLDSADPFCVVLPDDYYHGGPVGGIDANGNFFNFPAEFFYFVADSSLISTPGCGSSPPGKAFVRMADEGAFPGAPTNGNQMVFGRIRIVVTSGLCPNTTYTFTHPYGQVDITTDAAGGVRRNAATQDMGCFPVAPQTCDFNLALASPVSGGYLAQVNAPPGYLGDPNVPAAVTGSPYIAQREIDAAGPGGTPASANYFRIVNKNNPALLDLESNQFTVMGKLAGPLVAGPSSLDFGTIPVGAVSAEQTVTLTNDGVADLTINTVTKAGLMAGEFTITNNGCDGRLLQAVSVNPSNASCDVRVQFAPAANGTRVAGLSVNHTGRNNPLSVSLAGIGGAQQGEPAISVGPVALDFPDLHTGQTSASESVKVSNLGGTANLVIGGVTITGGGAVNFSLTNDCTVAVAPGAECSIDVRFNPVIAGDLAATLEIQHNVGVVANPLVVPLTGRGFAGVPAQSVATTSGFPSWFQDNNGVRLEPCLTTGDPNCVLLADAGFSPAQPVSFPTNFPSEFFYSLIDSNPAFTVTDPTCGATGDVTMRLALEGGFVNGLPVQGDQTTFARVRFVAHNLCPNSTYEFTHPYGTTRVTTNGVGAIPANAGTSDLFNVLAVRPLAGAPQQITGGGVLRWDPNSAPSAPAGYLGDARTFHPIVGSTFRPGGPGTEPANFMEVRPVDAGGNAGARLGRTSDFIVSGKLAGPVIADRTSLSFGSNAVGTATASQSVTITNLFPTTIGAITPSLGGADGGYFTITGGTCAPATSLARDQTCTVTVAFTPPLAGVVGNKTAVLTVAHDGLRAPVTVSLAGTATDPGQPVIQATPTTVGFVNQNVGTTSVIQNVTVSNTGNAALTGIIISKAGSNPADFVVTTNCPVSLGFGPPSPTCNITVAFAPAATGNKSAQVRIQSNDPVRPNVFVTLSGTGVAPVMAVSSTSLSFSTKGSSSTTLNVTNTGTAVLNLVGNPALQIVGSGLPTSAPTKFTASNVNCNNVAPGGKCSIKVTFTPGAGANNQTLTAILRINSNAVNSPFNLSLTGQRK